MIQLGQSGAGVVHIGVRHGRVLAEHIHALDVTIMNGPHDFHHGQAFFVGEVIRSPNIGKCRAHAVIGDRLIIRQEHRDQPGVRGTLHVVLPAQRVQPGAGAADLTAHQRQRDQAARVVRAVDMLRHAHAPENHARLGSGPDPRHVAQHIGSDAANIGHLFGREGLEMRLHLLPVFGVAVDILLVVKLLFHDHMHDRIQH